MIIPVSLGENSYDIILQRGSIKKIAKYIPATEKRQFLVVTDSGVPEEYSRKVAASLNATAIFSFPQGEKSKNFDTYKSICKTLLDFSFTRKDAVVAVGGGVVGDMAGFAAATYMRGIDFYNIPTTLLSQVDSSIGGKTGIDFGDYKNIIGAFHQPKKVIIDPDVLTTLPERHIKNGLAESIKMGITFDEELFDIFLRDNYMSKIESIIEHSLYIKRHVVEEDEKEAGLRKVLNFGHTIGHAIETTAGLEELYHGECVALGMTYMCAEHVEAILKCALKNVGLPYKYEGDKEKIYKALVHDKKSEGKEITVVKCDEIGSFRFEKMTPKSLSELI